MKKILIGTSNPGKRKEIFSALTDSSGICLPAVSGHEPIQFLSPEDLGISIRIPETGKTYAENALLKAKAFYAASGGIPTIAEDSGVEISALKGELGHNTRRWGEVARNAVRSEVSLSSAKANGTKDAARRNISDISPEGKHFPIGAGEQATDEEWLDFFMKRMAREKDRSARFICHAVYLDEKGPVHFEGECLGTITDAIEGPVLPGIPLSAVFKPVGQSLVYSAMGEQEKNKLSHRGKAIKMLRGWLLQGKPCDILHV